MASNTNEDLIRSHVDTIILSSLMKEDKYGLEILNEIKEKSNGLYTLKQATLYSILKRLEKVGYIKSYDGATSNGAARVYYSLLDLGRNVVLKDQYEWEYSRTIINDLLSDKPYDPDAEPPFDASALRPLTRRQPSTNVKQESEANYNESHSTTQVKQTKPVVNNDDSNDFVEEDNYEYTSENTGNDRLYHNPAPKLDKPSFDSIFNNSENEQMTFFQPKVEQSTPLYNNDKDQQTINYISSFENIYKSSNNNVSEPVVNSKEDDESYDFYTINELKSNFAREGYTIRPYIKKNTTEYYVGKYYMANKLLLASSLVFYLLMLIEIFSIHFGLHYPKQISLWLSIAAISIIPAYALIKWGLDKDKRSLAKFNLKNALVNSLIIIVNSAVIIVIVGYFGFKANFADAQSMVKPIIVPLVMLVNIPIAIGIYELLYKSKYFHIN